MSSHTRPKTLGDEILLQTEIFAAMGRRRCTYLALHAVERVHAKGEVVFSEDTRSEGLYILVRGALRLTIRTTPGGSVVLRQQDAPAAIITASLLDGGPNCANAVAKSKCITYTILRDPFIRFCRQNPAVSIRLLSEIGSHLRRTSAFIDLITTAGVYQRVARVLLDLMEEVGNPRFALPCSHTELAARLGTVRELIYRNLKIFETRGLLHFAGRHIIVTDVPALIAAAGTSIDAAHVFDSCAAPPSPAYFVLERSKGIHSGHRSHDSR